MKLTNQQRVNNISALIVSELRQKCEIYRKMLKEGHKLGSGEGMPEYFIKPEELKAALGENLKDVETVIEFVLDGKSNQINKGRGKQGK